MKKHLGIFNADKLNELILRKYNDSININVMHDSDDILNTIHESIKTNYSNVVVMDRDISGLKHIPIDSIVIVPNKRLRRYGKPYNLTLLLETYHKRYKFIFVNRIRRKQNVINPMINDMTMYDLSIYDNYKLFDIVLFLSGKDIKTCKVKVIKDFPHKMCKLTISENCKPNCPKCNELKYSMEKLADSLAYEIVYNSGYLRNGKIKKIKKP